MTSNLTPEKRVDKNGRLVTKHVRTDAGTGSNASGIPAPAISSSPKVEAKKQYADFEANKAKNEEPTGDTVMSPEDFKVFANLLGYGSSTNDDGDSRVYHCQLMLRDGAIGGAKTIVGYIKENEPLEDQHLFAFTAWEYLRDDNVIDAKHDYYSTPEDRAYYEHIMNSLKAIFEEEDTGFSEEDSLTDIGSDTIKSIARIYDLTDGDVSPSDISSFYYERDGNLDAEAFFDYHTAHSPVRSGVL